MDRISGAYPGGPQKRKDDSDGSRRPRLARAEEIEEQLQERQRSYLRRDREKRMVVGFVAAVVLAALAASTGFWMGRQANRTTEEIAAEQEGRPDRGFDLSQERNKVLQQLWLMEDLERVPRP